MTNVTQLFKAQPGMLSQIEAAVTAGVQSALADVSNDDLKAMIMAPYHELQQEMSLKLAA